MNFPVQGFQKLQHHIHEAKAKVTTFKAKATGKALRTRPKNWPERQSLTSLIKTMKAFSSSNKKSRNDRG